MNHALLLDTSSLMYRAFFALPTSITGGAGPVNAVRGYLDMLARLVSSRRPERVLHVLDDDWRPGPRVAAWEGYKATRAEDPPELPAQFTLLDEVLAALGAVVVAAPGWEADDAIGVLCARASRGDRLEIVTGDRDLLQLVADGGEGPEVRVLYTLKGVTELIEFDEAEVLARHGVPARRYVDYATLRGDPSDGLPGVRGVGEKTARELVDRYPDLGALAADTRSLTPKLAERVRDASGYLAAMRAVVPVRTDVEVRVEEHAADDERLEALAVEHNLEGPLRRLREAVHAP